MGKFTKWLMIFRLISMLIEELSTAASDNKITVKEAFLIIEKICNNLGIDFDLTGVDFNFNKKK